MSWRRPGDERNEKKTCLYGYFLLEVRNVTKLLQNYGLPRVKQIRILYLLKQKPKEKENQI